MYFPFCSSELSKSFRESYGDSLCRHSPFSSKWFFKAKHFFFGNISAILSILGIYSTWTQVHTFSRNTKRNKCGINARSISFVRGIHYSSGKIQFFAKENCGTFFRLYLSYFSLASVSVRSAVTHLRPNLCHHLQWKIYKSKIVLFELNRTISQYFFFSFLWFFSTCVNL